MIWGATVSATLLAKGAKYEGQQTCFCSDQRQCVCMCVYEPSREFLQLLSGQCDNVRRTWSDLLNLDRQSIFLSYLIPDGKAGCPTGEWNS